MADGIHIHADVHELASGVPERLEQLGVKVAVVPLARGDYCIEGCALIERKRVRDLHDSLVHGRFWRQIGGLRNADLPAFLLVEGLDLDDGPLHPNSIRGALLTVLEQGITILRSCDSEDSARWLYRLGARRWRTKPLAGRPVYAQRSMRDDRPSAALLAAVPGISVELATALLERFGSVAGVIEAGRTRWREVRGIGEVRAEALEEAFHANRVSDQWNVAKPAGPAPKRAKRATTFTVSASRKRPAARPAVEASPREEPASLARARLDRGT